MILVGGCNCPFYPSPHTVMEMVRAVVCIMSAGTRPDGVSRYSDLTQGPLYQPRLPPRAARAGGHGIS